MSNFFLYGAPSVFMASGGTLSNFHYYYTFGKPSSD